jgi:uncharacterized delta-60 repeat protein
MPFISQFYKIFCWVILCLWFSSVQAQPPGSLDSFLNTEGANQFVTTIQTQTDGKILIGGYFTSYNGAPQNYLARLNPNGSLDKTFNVQGSGSNGPILAITVQNDGKILIAGEFTAYNNQAKNYLARLHSDGTLDNTFNPSGSGPDIWVSDLVLQTDGKILISGVFTSYNGVSRQKIARLNSDGSIDSGFNPATTLPNQFIDVLVLQNNGRILVGGSFNSPSPSIPAERAFVRLNANGSIDNTFNGLSTFDFRQIFTAIQLPDDKILIAGDFDNYNGVSVNRIARLNADGSVDDTFYSPPFNFNIPYNGFIQSILRLPDGKLLIAGAFSSYNGNSDDKIVRLNADGTLDSSFNIGNYVPDFSLNALASTDDGSILIGGSFTALGDKALKGIAKLNSDGVLNLNFNTENGTNDEVKNVLLQPDGKILIGGLFDTYNGLTVNKIARLNIDGSLDNTFQLDNRLANDLYSIDVLAVQPDGKILIGLVNFTEGYKIYRLHTNGILDNSFDFGSGIGIDSQINGLVLQPDGKMLVFGYFKVYDGTSQNNVTRINPDGSLDNTFNIGSGPNNEVKAIKLQTDGKILMVGKFTTFNGINQNHITRLKMDGSLDNTFKVGSGTEQDILDLAIQPDGKILIVGYFRFYQGVSRNLIARLHTDGKLDNTFNSDYDIYFVHSKIILLPDAKILLKTGSRSLIRLNPNGSLDDSFNPTSIGGWINSLVLQPNGRALIAGFFDSYGVFEIPRKNLARIYCSPPFIPQGLQNSEVIDNSFKLSWLKIIGIDEYEIDVSDNNFTTNLPNYFNRFTQDTTLLINGLTAGKIYYCRVRAINEQGASPNSNPLEVVLKPEKPLGLTAKPLSINQIQLSWEFNPLAGNTYKLQSAQDSADVFQDITLVNSNTYTHSGLKAGTTYYYRLQAFKNGVFSDFSEIVGANTFTDEIVTDLEETQAGIQIYPNPASNQMVKVDWKNSPLGLESIQILNQWGQTIQILNLGNSNQTSFQLNTNTLANGFYVIRFLGKDNGIVRKLIVKNN